MRISTCPQNLSSILRSQSCTDIIFPLHSERTGPFGGTALILGIIITLKDLIDVLNFLKYNNIKFCLFLQHNKWYTTCTRTTVWVFKMYMSLKTN